MVKALAGLAGGASLLGPETAEGGWANIEIDLSEPHQDWHYVHVADFACRVD